MSKKKSNRARDAARGTSADPALKSDEKLEVSPADALRRQAVDNVARSSKVVGVMPEALADEVRESGVYPFTFTSAFIIAGALLVGTIFVPFLATRAGATVGEATTCAVPPLAALALAFTRFFIDSKRGFCRGFFITLGVAFACCLLLCWLLFYQGILI